MLATLQNDILVTEEQYFELKVPSTLTKIRKQIEIHRGTKKRLENCGDTCPLKLCCFFP